MAKRVLQRAEVFFPKNCIGDQIHTRKEETVDCGELYSNIFIEF